MKGEGRASPWTRLAEAIGDPRFEEIRADLVARKITDLDRDAFLLNGVVGALLREMVPEEAPADAVIAYGALLHSVYCCWARDWPVATVDATRLRASLSTLHTSPFAERSPLAVYIQLPPHLVWAEPTPGSPHEPLDGVFLLVHGDRAMALAVLGFHELREGFTTMEGDLRLPAAPPAPRPDGTPPFSPALPGGDLAKLVSLVDTHELASLALIALAAAEQG